MRYYAEVISTTMLKGTRISVGLGLPPTIFTTNASESLNAALKRKVDHKETEWPRFNDAVKQYILGQRDNVLRAISSRGEYKILQEYGNLMVTPEKWTKMTPEQRKCVVKRFDSAKVKFTKAAETGASTSQSVGRSHLASQLSSVVYLHCHYLCWNQCGTKQKITFSLMSRWFQPQEVIQEQKWLLLILAQHLTSYRSNHRANICAISNACSGALLRYALTLL